MRTAHTVCLRLQQQKNVLWINPEFFSLDVIGHLSYYCFYFESFCCKHLVVMSFIRYKMRYACQGLNSKTYCIMQPSSFMLFFSEMVWRYIFYFLSPALNEVLSKKFLKHYFHANILISRLPTEINILNDLQRGMCKNLRELCTPRSASKKQAECAPRICTLASSEKRNDAMLASYGGCFKKRRKI